MKKILLFVVFAIISNCIYAQKDDMYGHTDSTSIKKSKNNIWGGFKTAPGIIKDAVSADSMRHIMTTERTCRIDKKKSRVGCDVCLRSVGFLNEPCQYQLSLFVFLPYNSKISIRKDSPVLIKLSDNETLRLNVLSDSEDLLGSSGFLGNYLYTTYSVLALAAIDDDVINKIKKGISKIRIELNYEPVDIILKEDNISDFIYKNYQLLKKQSQISNSFEKGF